jgi:ketosteroid isomerase-like protein
MNFEDYIRVFNSGDRAELATFFTEDIVFWAGGAPGGPRVIRGKDDVLRFLAVLADGVREIIRAQVVLQDEKHIFAEIDMDIHAMSDKPDFAGLGPLKASEFLTMKFFVVYTVRGGRICEIKTSLWPTNFGVSDPPTRSFGPPTPVIGGIRKRV